MSSVQAAEWRIEPLLRAAYDYDDNATLSSRTDEDLNISGSIIDASARFAYASETTDLSITPRVSSRNYDVNELDENEGFLYYDFSRRTQSSTFRLRGDYIRESVRQAERADADLDVEDPDEIPDDESGRVGVQGTRDKLRVVPNWTYRMSEASSLSIGLNYSVVEYDDVLAGLLNDHENAQANMTYRRDWSPRNTAILTGTYRQYSVDGQDDVHGSGIRAGFEQRLSETTRVRALVGLEDTELRTGGSDVNWVANLSLTRRLQTITMLAQYRRTVSGGGSGNLSSRDSFNLNFTRRLTERISAGLGVRAYQTDSLSSDPVVVVNDRNYVQLRSQFTWDLTRNWSLEANYRYTFSDRSEIGQSLGESANSNNITVWLNYRPTPITRAR